MIKEKAINICVFSLTKAIAKSKGDKEGTMNCKYLSVAPVDLCGRL